MVFHRNLAASRQAPQRHSWLATLAAVSLLSQGPLSVLGLRSAQAATLNRFCQVTAVATTQKETLLKAAVKGNTTAQSQYRQQIAQDADQLRQCRSQNWPQAQAIWLRLYPCDLRPGVLEGLLDRIVSKGYNRVYVEVFYDGQVLLPPGANPTAWPSVVQNSQEDLLAQSIQKGRERGLQVYGWLYSMNFGYSYGQRADRQQSLARNGAGQTSLTVTSNDNAGRELFINTESDKAFIDPYDSQARQDYARLLQEVLKRRPDGMLFDYIRYPKQVGAASIINKTKELWIYGPAALQALYNRAENNKGRELIRRFTSQGYVTVNDVAQVDRLYPQEREPLWQGRTPPPFAANKPLPSAASRQPRIQQELWLLAVAHTYQGVVDFLTAAAYPSLQQGIPAGAVFFPEANRRIGEGFDSRLQPWNQFPSALQWHPMAYGVCGNSSCIVEQVQTVLREAPQGTQVSPVLAGTWGRSMNNRPSLEAQMDALRQTSSRVNSVSHFDFNWIDPAFASARRSCSVSY
jgi:hypothetical protein